MDTSGASKRGQLRSPVKASSAGMEALTRLARRAKPLEGFRVLGFFALTSVFVLLVLCCLFLDYGGLLSSKRSASGSRAWGLGLETGGGEDRRGEVGGEGCDWFEGEWVWDEGYPLYESSDCPFLDQGFRCSENGRPDRFFTKWRWQPARCQLPRF